MTHAGMIIGGGGSVSFDGYYDLTRGTPDITVVIMVNGTTVGTFTQTDLGTDDIDGHSSYYYENTHTLRVGDLVTITALTNSAASSFFPVLLGTDTSGIGEQLLEVMTPGSTAPPRSSTSLMKLIPPFTIPLSP